LRLLWERKPRRQTGQWKGLSSAGMAPLPFLLGAYSHLVSQIVDGFVTALAIGNHRQLWRAAV
jgi:hypothetical protein